MIKGIFIVFSMAMILPVYSAPLPEWAIASNSAQVEHLNLKESILFALNRDPSVRQQIAKLGIGEAQIDEARSAWYPQISLSGSTGHSSTTDSSGALKSPAAYGLTITQLVYDFGKANNTIYQQQNQRDSYRYQLMAGITEVAEKTALAYIDVKRYQALSAAARENIRALENIQRLAEDRSGAGLNTSSDVLQARTRIAGMRATLEQYQAAQQSATAKLGVLTGIIAGQYHSLPVALIDEQKPLQYIDYNNIPAVMSAKSTLASSGFAVDKAKAGHWPTISVKGGKTRYESSSRDYWNDNIQLSIDAPVWQGGMISARVAQAEGERRVAASQVEQAKFDIQQKASVAMADWLGAKGREDASEIQLTSALGSRNVYRDEYTLGKRSLTDLLSIEQDVYQATYSKVVADFDGWSAAVNYAAAVDNLLPLTGIEKQSTSILPDLK